MHIKCRPLHIHAALDESIWLNSLSDHLANPGCGGELLLVSVGEGLTSMQVGPVADVAVGTL